MSREKVSRLMSMSDVDMAVYRSKRNQRSFWQRLNHNQWVEFCNKMAGWFKEHAHDEWDQVVALNNSRKLGSDVKAHEKADIIRANRKKKG